jgi:hypothetical protein
VLILRELQMRFAHEVVEEYATGKSLRAGKGRRALSYKVRAGVGSAEEKFDQWRSGGA